MSFIFFKEKFFCVRKKLYFCRKEFQNINDMEGDKYSVL